MSTHTSKTPKKKVVPEQFFEHDEYTREDDTGVKYFDWKSISSICISPAPHHPAYGMSFEDYATRRSEFGDEDGKPPTQISFRILPLMGFFLPSMARRRASQTRGSLYRYLTLIIEMGLIKFQKDYHETYAVINASADLMMSTFPMDSMEHEWACLMFSEHTINLDTCPRTNKHYTPQVAQWLGAAIKQVAGDLKISQSDLIVLCICLGVAEDSKTKKLPDAVQHEFSKIVKRFEFYLDVKGTQSKAMADKYSKVL